MKQIIFLTILTISFMNCKAQTILSLENDTRWRHQGYSYFKDLNNVLNTFEGTWLYTNGNTSLKIKLKKIVKYHYKKGPSNYYGDLIIGGYQYIENNVEKINTLQDASTPNIGYGASIKGSTIFDDCVFLPAPDCINGEKRLYLTINDVKSQHHIGTIVLHKRTINGKTALRVIMDIGYTAKIREGKIVPKGTLPWQGDFILFKQ